MTPSLGTTYNPEERMRIELRRTQRELALARHENATLKAQLQFFSQTMHESEQCD